MTPSGVKRRWLRRIALLLAAALFAGSPARAEPLRTWGGEKTPPEPSSDGAPPVEPEPEPDPPPPPPPPTTIGTPVDGGAPDGAPPLPAEGTRPPGPEAPPVEPVAPIVRMPGRVGLRYQLEGIEVSGNASTHAHVILRYVPFKTGATLDVDDRAIAYTRFRLLGTGFFRDVQLSLRRGSRRGLAILVIRVVERNTIVVNDLWLGISADAEPDGRARPLTAYGGIDVSERNLAGTGLTLGGAVAIADGQLALRTRFADPQVRGSPWLFNAELLYNGARDFFGNRDVLVDDPEEKVAQDFAVVDYRRFGGAVGFGRDLGLSSQLFLDYRLEKLDANLPLAASHRRGLDVEPIDFHMQRGSSLLSTVRGTLIHDTRDDPFLPRRGVHLAARSEVSLTPLGSDYPYAKLQIRASRWAPLPWGHVFRVEGFAGTIFGDAPLFERYYVGDFTDLLPDRVLDLNFDRRAAPNFFGTTIGQVRYGSYAARANLEYRVPLYRGTRAVYGVDFFGAAGLYAVADDVDLTRPASGYTGIAKIPFDLTFNAGLRVETSAGGFAFGISSLIGFIPVRSDGR